MFYEYETGYLEARCAECDDYIHEPTDTKAFCLWCNRETTVAYADQYLFGLNPVHDMGGEAYDIFRGF